LLNSNKKIAIIGGGAAGMISAATLVECSKDIEIHVFEKNNKLGLKVALTGGGRCNVTTGIDDFKLLQRQYIRGWEFLKPSISGFPPKKVREWFESKGLKLKEEDNKRIFPISDNGQDVVAVFEKILANKNVKIHFREGVDNIIFKDKYIIDTKNDTYTFDYVVISTGGNAYSQTGSNGDGYNLAKQLGHSITQLGPSLNSLEVFDTWCKELLGLSFPNSELKVKLSNGSIKSVKGSMLFTHFGITGPAVFALASEIAFEKFNNKSPLEIQFIPISGNDFSFWDKNLLDTLAKNNTKQIDNTLATFFPMRFCEKILEICKVDSKKRSSDITKAERQFLAHLFSGDLKIKLKSRRVGDEFVTAGGVDSTEINRTTMESRIHNGLYFAGEILNVDGLTGGFNLQAAWSTGRLVGQSIIKII
jgi:predicted Rossmann fold flavoprotein